MKNDIYLVSELSVAKIDRDDFAGAIEDLNKALEDNPYYQWGYLYRGIAKMGMFNYKSALSDINRALSIDPEFEIACSTRDILMAEIRKTETGFRRLFKDTGKIN